MKSLLIASIAFSMAASTAFAEPVTKPDVASMSHRVAKMHSARRIHHDGEQMPLLKTGSMVDANGVVWGDICRNGAAWVRPGGWGIVGTTCAPPAFPGFVGVVSTW